MGARAVNSHDILAFVAIGIEYFVVDKDLDQGRLQPLEVAFVHLGQHIVEGIPVHQVDLEQPTDVSAEPGFRFFPGFCRHITDTMKRIPFIDPITKKKHANGVFDNLVKVSRCMIARCDQPPIYALTEFPSNKEDMETISYDLMVSFLCHKHCITKDEAKQHIEENSLKEDIAFFAQKVWQLMTSCQSTEPFSLMD